ncbi:MAG TPA: hypothetical protein VI958_00090, partial [Acidobacteriota bacterium]
MPKRDPDHAYEINKLNMYFAISSIIMFLFFIWMMWQDFHRDWKHFQAEFRRLDLAKTRAAAAQEDAQLQNNAEYQQILQQLQTAEAELQQKRKDHSKALEDQKDIQGEWYNADQKFRFAKAEYEAKRYDYEEAKAEHPDEAQNREKELNEIHTRMQDLSAELDQVNAKKAQMDDSVTAFTKRIDELEKAQTRLRTKLDRLLRKEETIAPSVANIFRNLPFVDFIDPS